MSENYMSNNLLPEEKELVLELLGSSTCFSMGVAELAVSQSTITTDDIINFDWKSIIKPGVVCLLQDPLRDWDYFIRVFDLDRGTKVWDHRIELNTRATRRRRHLILLDSLFGVFTACLNFVDDDEADIFSIFMSDYVGFDDCKRSPEDYLEISSIKSNGNSISRSSSQNEERKKETQKVGKNVARISMRNEKRYNELQHGCNSEKISNQFRTMPLKRQNEEMLEKVRVFLNVAGHDMSIFDDPRKSLYAHNFFQKEQKAIEAIDITKTTEYGNIHEKKHFTKRKSTNKLNCKKYDLVENPYYNVHPSLKEDCLPTLKLVQANSIDNSSIRGVKSLKEQRLESKNSDNTDHSVSDVCKETKHDSITKDSKDVQDVNFSSFREKLVTKRDSCSSLAFKKSPLPPKRSNPPPPHQIAKPVEFSRNKWKFAKGNALKKMKYNSLHDGNPQTNLASIGKFDKKEKGSSLLTKNDKIDSEWPEEDSDSWEHSFEEALRKIKAVNIIYDDLEPSTDDYTPIFQ